MLTATANDSYDDFVLYGSDTLKAALRKDDFQAGVKAFGAAFHKGYGLEPLGQLWQRGQVVHLWKLVLPGRDDHLLRMSILDGRVSGILIQ